MSKIWNLSQITVQLDSLTWKKIKHLVESHYLNILKGDPIFERGIDYILIWSHFIGIKIWSDWKYDKSKSVTLIYLNLHNSLIRLKSGKIWENQGDLIILKNENYDSNCGYLNQSNSNGIKQHSIPIHLSQIFWFQKHAIIPLIIFSLTTGMLKRRRKIPPPPHPPSSQFWQLTI